MCSEDKCRIEGKCPNCNCNIKIEVDKPEEKKEDVRDKSNMNLND